jgi:hypothetical protein
MNMERAKEALRLFQGFLGVAFHPKQAVKQATRKTLKKLWCKLTGHPEVPATEIRVTHVVQHVGGAKFADAETLRKLGLIDDGGTPHPAPKIIPVPPHTRGAKFADAETLRRMGLIADEAPLPPARSLEVPSRPIEAKRYQM